MRRPQARFVIDVILPAKDQAGALPELLSRMPAGCRPIVVDNGSVDGTGDVARSCGAVVVHEMRAGYGAAVHAGLLAATAYVVAVMDADGSVDPRELAPLVLAVTAGGSDLAMGRRRPQPGAWPWHARAGNAMLALSLRHTLGLSIHDVGTVRVARREALLDLGVMDRRFGYPVETLVRAASAGWSVTEHDMTYAPRAAGTRSNVSGTLRGSLRAAVDLRNAVT